MEGHSIELLHFVLEFYTVSSLECNWSYIIIQAPSLMRIRFRVNLYALEFSSL